MILYASYLTLELNLGKSHLMTILGILKPWSPPKVPEPVEMSHKIVICGAGFLGKSTLTSTFVPQPAKES